jgi:peptidyl-prolyl cis-trans isomerase C
LDAAIQNIQKNYPDDISFRRALADEGLSFERWEARLNHTLLERLVVDELRKELKKPTPEQVRTYYQSHKDQFQQTPAVRLRQIVLETEENALRIKKEIQAGKSIASLAKKFSITSEAQSDGDTGWIEKGTLDVFDAAFRMSPGQKSQIVKSPFGFHIFELVSKRPAKTLSIDEASKKIEALLSAQNEQNLYSAWLEEQILKARVYKDDEFLKQIQVLSRSE